MIYIDHPKIYPGKRKAYSHMLADSLEELHEFAASIGVKRCWFHRDHYDVDLDGFHAAVLSGAAVVSTRQLVILRKK